MPIVEGQLLAGRSAAQKAALARGEITSAVRRVLGCEPGRVQVLIHEVTQDQWYRAGTPITTAGGSDQ